MRLRILSAILIVSVAIVGIQKWNSYEKTRPMREAKQQLSQMLDERQLPLNPIFAKKPNLSIPSPVTEEARKNLDNSEEKKPLIPAA